MRAVSERGLRSSHASIALRFSSKGTVEMSGAQPQPEPTKGGKPVIELRQRPRPASDARPRSAIIVRYGVEFIGTAVHEHLLDVAADRDDALARFVGLCRRRRQPEPQSQQRGAEAHPAKHHGASPIADWICDIMARAPARGKVRTMVEGRWRP
jgi:hypothetical protein